jgi:hypothetical protein
MAPHYALQKALVPEVVESLILPVTLARGVDEGQVLRLAAGQEVLLVSREEEVL